MMSLSRIHASVTSSGNMKQSTPRNLHPWQHFREVPRLYSIVAEKWSLRPPPSRGLSPLCQRGMLSGLIHTWQSNLTSVVMAMNCGSMAILSRHSSKLRVASRQRSHTYGSKMQVTWWSDKGCLYYTGMSDCSDGKLSVFKKISCNAACKIIMINYPTWWLCRTSCAHPWMIANLVPYICQYHTFPARPVLRYLYFQAGIQVQLVSLGHHQKDGTLHRIQSKRHYEL